MSNGERGITIPPVLQWHDGATMPTDYHDNYIVGFADPVDGALFFCCARNDYGRFVYDIAEYNQYPEPKVFYWAKLPRELDIIYLKETK